MTTRILASSEIDIEHRTIHTQILQDLQIETSKPQDKKNALLKII
jgi:hypothetical protein